MSSLFNSSSLGRSLKASPAPSSPSSSSTAGDTKPSSPEASTATPLPYQPRRRTPGGSTSSIPPPLPLGDSTSYTSRTASGSLSSSPNLHTMHTPPGVQITSPTSSASGATPTANALSFPQLFSSPVTPTTSTTDLSSSASLIASSDTTPTATLSSSSTQPSSSSTINGASSSRDATGRLQLTNLKATAQQSLGLSNDSLGMKMLETLVQHGASTPEWRSVVELLLEKKVTLMVPAAPAGSGEVNVGLIRDHLALVDPGDGTKASGVCVLLRSGLVGNLGENDLTFESYLSPDAPSFALLLDPLTRKNALASITFPPLSPATSSSTGLPSETAIPYPSVTPTLAALLPFPPPTPPAPAPEATLSPASKSNRRASLLPTAPRNPFANLFGRPRAVSASPVTPAPGPESEETTPDGQSVAAATTTDKSTPSATPMEVELKSTPPGSRPLSVHSNRSRSPSPSRSTNSPSLRPKTLAADDAEKEKDDKQVLQIAAMVISTALKPAEIYKALGKTWRSRLAEALDDHSLPSTVVKGVQRFACLPLPLAAHGKSTTAPPSAFKKTPPAVPTALTATLPALTDEPDVLAGAYQDFFSLVHEELEATYRKEMVRTLAAEEEHVREGKRDEREREIEQRALQGVDEVEDCITRYHYNYLFSPENSNDKKHDEVLAGRIAALNMLGLTLDHLGVMTSLPDGGRNEAVWNGLEALAKVVGDELQKIGSSDNLTPQAKTQVLVVAHKLVIEGLRELPPVRLRPEGEKLPPTSPATDMQGPAEPEETTSAADPTPISTVVKSEALSTPSDAIGDPLSPTVTQHSTVARDGDSFSVKSDPLLAGGLEEAMTGSILDLPSRPEQEDTASIQSVVSTAGITSPISIEQDDRSDSAPTPVKEEVASGADLLLPLIIYAVVKSNPTHFVSHLLFIQRYRSSFAFSGEASYALVNSTAVVDFLENVNLDSLGLAGEDKVLSADFHSFDDILSKDIAALSSPQAQAAAQSRLRGRVSQVSDFASSGLNNVAATGLGALRSLIENGQMAAEGFMIQVPGVPARPAILGRKTSGFSIANLTASVAGIAASAGGRVREGSISSVGSPAQGTVAAPTAEWGVKREMMDVSRPSSIYERPESPVEDDEDDEAGVSRSDEDDEGETGSLRREADARSVRSTRSVASTRSVSLKADGVQVGSPASERLSISERFARMSTGGSTSNSGAESPIGLGVAGSLPKATPFLPSTTKNRSASNSVSSLTPSTRRATILAGATFIPPSSPNRSSFSATASPPDPASTSSATPSIPLPPLSQAHLPSSPLSTFSTSTLPLDGKPQPPKHDDNIVRPPIERFLELEQAGDVKLGDVAELLEDYQRLARVIKALGVWD